MQKVPQFSFRAQDSLDFSDHNSFDFSSNERGDNEDYLENNICFQNHEDIVHTSVGTLRESSCSSTESYEDELNDESYEHELNDESYEYELNYESYDHKSNDESSFDIGDNGFYKKLLIITILLVPIFTICFQFAPNFIICSQMYEKFQKFVHTPSLNELLDEQFHIYNFINQRKQLELKQNLIAKINDQSESDPLSIFILHTHHQSTNVSMFAKNIGHIFSKHNSGGQVPIFAYPDSDLFNKTSDIEKIWDSRLEVSDTVIIQNFTGLAWDYAKIFLKYCDNDNAPFRNRLFIFLATINNCNINNPDKSIEENLMRVWNVEDETVEALIVRISSISICAINQ